VWQHDKWRGDGDQVGLVEGSDGRDTQSDRGEKRNGRDEGKHEERHGPRGDHVGITNSDTSLCENVARVAVRLRSCYARRYIKLGMERVCKGLLPCCIITEDRIEALVRPHNGAMISFRRTLAITLRVPETWSRSKVATFLCPCCSANWYAVRPSSFNMHVSAPLSSNSSTIPRWP
jgi:hypothetical protein